MKKSNKQRQTCDKEKEEKDIKSYKLVKEITKFVKK